MCNYPAQGGKRKGKRSSRRSIDASSRLFLPARGIDYFPFSRFEPLIVEGRGCIIDPSFVRLSTNCSSGRAHLPWMARLPLRSREVFRKIRNFLLVFEIVVRIDQFLLTIALFNSYCSVQSILVRAFVQLL